MRIWLMFVAACGGGGGSSIDSAPSADAYDTARCLIKGTYGALGMVSGTAGTAANNATTVTVTLDPGPPGKDDFFLKMVPGHGVFTGGVAPGTYTIAGVDANFLTCGLCTHIIADIIAGQGPSKFYFAHSGTITLTSTTPPIHGTGTNLALAEIDINSGAEISGGCTATIDSIEFSTP